VAAVARDPDVSHAAAAPSGFPGRLAEAWRPAHLRLAGPQLVAERAGFRLVIEQRSGHLNDHALTSCHESMIIVTRTDDRCREPSPCRVTAQRGFSARYSREPRGSARLQPSRRDSPPLPSTARAPAADPRILSEIAPGTGSTRPMYGLVRPLPRPRISVTISVVPLKPRRIPRPSAPPGVPPPPLSARPGRCRAGTQPGTRSRRGRRSPARRRWLHDMAADQQPVRPPPMVTAESVASSKAQSYQRDPLAPVDPCRLDVSPMSTGPIRQTTRRGCLLAILIAIA
jgi:hypothetical protein